MTPIHELIDRINNHRYIVDEWLLNALEEEYRKGSYSNRNNVEALALEFTLYKAGGFKRPATWRYDLQLSESLFIDLKRRPKWSNNISLSNKGRLEESYNMGQLTHIVSFTQNIETDYKLGDVLTFKADGYLPIMEALRVSQTKMRSYKLLDKNRLQVA